MTRIFRPTSARAEPVLGRRIEETLTIQEEGGVWVIRREPGAAVVVTLVTPGWEDFAFRAKPRLEVVERVFRRMRRAAKAVGRL